MNYCQYIIENYLGTDEGWRKSSRKWLGRMQRAYSADDKEEIARLKKRHTELINAEDEHSKRLEKAVGSGKHKGNRKFRYDYYDPKNVSQRQFYVDNL